MPVALALVVVEVQVALWVKVLMELKTLPALQSPNGVAAMQVSEMMEALAVGLDELAVVVVLGLHVVLLERS